MKMAKGRCLKFEPKLNQVKLSIKRILRGMASIKFKDLPTVVLRTYQGIVSGQRESQRVRQPERPLLSGPVLITYRDATNGLVQLRFGRLRG
ncbi:hypothetical protein ACLKA7_006196 [Drosophila subpalustris]